MGDISSKTKELTGSAKQAVSQSVDSRVVIAALAGIAVVVALAVRRNRRTSGSKKHPPAH